MITTWVWQYIRKMRADDIKLINSFEKAGSDSILTDHDGFQINHTRSAKITINHLAAKL